MADGKASKQVAFFSTFRVPLIAAILVAIVGISLWAVPVVIERNLEIERQEALAAEARAEKKAEKDAERAEKEAANMRQCQTLVKKHEAMLSVDYPTARPEGFVTLEGEGARERVVERISATFPFMMEAVAVVEAEKGPYTRARYRSTGHNYVNGLMLQWLAADTRYTFAPNDEQLEELLSNPDASSYNQEQEAWRMVRSCWEKLNKEGTWGPVDFDEIVVTGFELVQAHLACERDGFVEDFKEPIPCAEVSYQKKESDQRPGPTTQRDPFLEPYRDATQQLFAEFSWCYNRGLEVNAAGTGCE